MTLRKTGRHPRQRWALLGGAVAVMTLAVAAMTLAVHDLKFELDGNIVKDGSTTFDWADIFDANGNEKASLPAGFTAAGFNKDFNNSGTTFQTSDASTYATGSKDTLPIATGWQCNADNNVNGKVDIMNAYATAFTDTKGTVTTTDDDQIVYFALERWTNTGDANVAFWFLQDNVGCDSAGGTANFTGTHKDGDLLIVSAFTNGGTVSNIDVYRWNGGSNGSLGTTPVAHGVDCRSSDTPAGDSACAAANTGTISTPWLTANKQDGVAHSLRTAEFFEGGVNLTKSNLGGKCFNVFIADTRSSQSLTATLFDYARGIIGECETTLSTTASLNGSTTSIDNSATSANGTASSGTDTANLSISGVDSWGGTLNFYLCGPTTGVCNNGGVLVTSRTVSSSSPASDFVSGSATLTSAGRYCWFVSFAPDQATSDKGVNGATHAGSGTNNPECFSISPVTPTLDTLAGTSPVDLGNAVSDTATLSNAAKEPGSNGSNANWPTINATNGAFVGTIGFTLKGPDNPAATPPVCSTTNAGAFAGESQTFPITSNVTGNGSYGSVSFKPSAPGQYHWVATYSYSGTAVNNNLPVTHNADCSDGDENVTVRQIPTSIATTQRVFPQDSATITSSLTGDNLPSGGTVIFRLYQAGGGNTALQNCQAHGDTLNSGGLIYKETVSSVGGAHQVTVGTDNKTVAVSANGTYYWYVTYAPGDTAHTGRQSDCAENTVLTFNNDAGPGTVFP